MCRDFPAQTEAWRLVLVGGSTPGNEYLEELKEAVEKSRCAIEVRANAAVSEIKDYYRRAAIFWHACGLHETRPERVEHFGMTTVESMQNCCVPIVIDGGGQREIVEHGESGFRFSNLEELKTLSLSIMVDPERRLRMAERAYERSHLFSLPVFREKLEHLLDGIELELLGRDKLPGARA
jgi:glycosyltransferase involved in cell wall biosynthesis